jgi:aminomethyltransferase
MVANRGDHLYLVVNAACKHDDLARIKAALSGTCEIEAQFDRGLIALQGPAAEGVLSSYAPKAEDMLFMDVTELEIAGVPVVVSRSGYTGEDGYEISIPAEETDRIARLLLSDDHVEPIGLGARDSLRLEAGLCLYGNDIDETTTPVEASLKWAIQKVRRSGGDAKAASRRRGDPFRVRQRRLPPQGRPATRRQGAGARRRGAVCAGDAAMKPSAR